MNKNWRKSLNLRQGLAQISSTVLLSVLSFAIVGGGFFWLLDYENAPGAIGQLSSSWPVESSQQLDKELLTLLLFAHPRCPCTRASLRELELLMAHCLGKVHATVLFYVPQNAGEEWEQSDLWKIASRIPGISVRSDIDNFEANLFGAETSGFTVLYETNGKLLFNGGITGSRGHEGDNLGRSSLYSLIMHGHSRDSKSFVFGCSLRDQAKLCEGE